MGILTYAATISVDGYIADPQGKFEWAVPGDDVFALHVERIKHVTTEILGRRTYELMDYWEETPFQSGTTPDEQEFAQYWQQIEKFVVSTTLAKGQLSSNKAQLVRELPLAHIRRIVAATNGIVEIFGPTTAAEALRAGLVDRLELFIVPVLIGGGVKAFPEGAYHAMKLCEQQTLDNGVVYLRYERIPSHRRLS